MLCSTTTFGRCSPVKILGSIAYLICLTFFVQKQLRYSQQSLKHQTVQQQQQEPQKKQSFRYTFDDPTFYLGPIVEGWPPSKNRSMSVYIRPEDEMVALNNISCLDLVSPRIELLIIVQSAPDMFDRRETNRRTWMQYQIEYPDVKSIFLMGNTNTEDKEALRKEQENNCDLVQLDYVDHYSNVTLDTVMALKFVKSQRWRESTPKFVMILDDDAYVNIPALRRRLFNYTKDAANNSRLLGCRFTVPNTAVHFPEKDFNTTLLPKKAWTYCPQYMFNQPTYPDFLSGAGYIIPFHLVDCLYEKCLEMPYFHINDVFVTGFARELCRYELTNELLMCYKDLSQEQVTAGRLLFHHITEELKYVAHNLTRAMKSGF